MNQQYKIRTAVIAVVAALGSLGISTAVRAGDVNIGIRIGEPAPPPPSVTVVTYDTYVVGYRRSLYDADWRLRTAQCDEVTAGRELDAAQRHQGEVAIALDDQEALVKDLQARVGGAAANAAEARIRLGALEKRIASARSDLDSARVLRDGPGIADAERRLRDNEAAAAATVEEIKRCESAAEARARLAAAEQDMARIRADFEVAHDAVFACRNRLADAHDRVCLALHDRDEAMWLLYRDDIMFGRVRPETVGFRIDLAQFGGRMPRDPEVLHAYVVRDVGYWRERPVEIQTRVVEVDRVTEVTRIREVQRGREGTRVKEIEVVETTYTPEQRLVVAERVTVERKRYEVEKVERSSGRRPQVSDAERAEAKAIVTKAQAEAKATEMKAHADAKATEMKAHADAKATEMQAHADAKATKETAHADAKAKEMTAHADAKSTEMTAHADAKSKEMTAHADAKATKETAHADAKATEMTSHADAKSKEMESHADAKSKEMQGHADAKVTKEQAQADAKAKEAQARADAKVRESQSRVDSKPSVRTPDVSSSRDVRGSKDPRGSDPRVGADPRDPRAGRDDKAPAAKSKNGKKDPRDPRDPTQASTDDPVRR